MKYELFKVDVTPITEHEDERGPWTERIHERRSTITVDRKTVKAILDLLGSSEQDRRMILEAEK